MSAPGALSGITVIEVGLHVQGPQAAALLGQLGADVIKVELPRFGDQARWIPISSDDPRSAYFLACNRGKRSVTLDLRIPEGRDVFLLLAERADVVLTNLRSEAMAAWGLGDEEVRARNPRLVYAIGSAFGPFGPDARRSGADLSAQSAGGLIRAIGGPDGAPRPIGVTIADHIASQNLVAGVLAALLARERTGVGQRVDVSLLGSQIWAQASEYTYYLTSGEMPGPPHRGNAMIPGIYGVVPTADGALAVVGVPSSRRRAFFAAIDRDGLEGDERFSNRAMSEEHKHVLFDLLADSFVTKTTAEWIGILDAIDVRVAPVRTYAEAVNDPQPWANDYLVESPDTPGDRVVGTPISLSATPARVGSRPPELGQHTEEVLLEAGYSWEEISALRTAGAI